MKTSLITRLTELLWDAWCIVSVVGVWPRFIEPNLLRTTKLQLQIPKLPPSLNGIKILQFSDLHLHPRTPPSFLKKLKTRISELNPDLIFFTGDFICYSQLDEKERLKNFLNELQAPYGCFAIFGNHDYSNFVSVNGEGDYDVLNPEQSSLKRALKRLFINQILTKRITAKAFETQENNELVELLKETPFQVLNNTTIQLPVRDTKINLSGLGEFMLGKCLPEKAFKQYDPAFPGIVLLHNPDGIPLLQNFPGEVILCGHTHGGQVYLPGIWKKFTLMENIEFLRGLKQIDRKWVYINSGVGSVLPFRWFSMPEILLITLEAQDEA